MRWLLPLLLAAWLSFASARAVAEKTAAPPTPFPGDAAKYALLREEMVAKQLEARGIKDARVLAAMRRAPRHLFVPPSRAARAYQDHPLPIGHKQTISQPYIVAFMTESLAVKPGEKALEVGTGSGYQAAILAEVGAEVWTIEIVEPLGKEAAERLKRLGYGKVRAKVGDGYLGWPEAAPFDAIIVTCAPEEIPKPLVEQLKTGGRMCIPVGPEGGEQSLLMLSKQPDGTLKKESILPVRFVPMTGKAAGGKQGGEANEAEANENDLAN